MKALRQVWGETLAEIGNENPRMLVLDADVANSTRSDIFADAHPDKFLQMGIAEQNMIGVAAGLAAQGFVPWLSSFSVFLTHRAIDPIRMLVAQSGANVKIAGAYAGLLTGQTGRTHQDVEDIAILRAMPKVTLLSPGDPAECAAMTRWATEHDGPVYLRLARDPAPDLFDQSAYEFVPGGVITLAEGDDVTLISTGVQSTRVLQAATLLGEKGIGARVLHLPTIKPVDESALLAAIGSPRLIVTVEDHTVIGGLGGLVAEVISGTASHAPLKRIGLDDVWTESAPNDFLLDKYGLSESRIAAAVADRLSVTV